MSPRDALIDMAIPAVVSAIVLLIAYRPGWGRPIGDGRWGGPLALALAFAVALPRVMGAVPRLYPVSAPGSIFYIALLAGVVGCADVLLRPPNWIRLPIALLALGAASLFVLANRLRQPDAQTHALLWAIAMTIAGTAAWWIFERPERPRERVAAPAGMLLLALFSGAVLGMSHSIQYGRLGMTLAAAVAPMALLGLGLPRFAVGGSVVVFGAILFPLLLAGRFFTDLTLTNLLLLVAAPICFRIAQSWIPQRWPALLRVLAYLLALSLPCLLAVGLALPGFLQTLNDTVTDYANYGQYGQ